MPKACDKGRARSWMITWNNPPEDALDKIRTLDPRYLTGQKEVGANGTPHLQIYVEFNDPMRFSKLKKLDKSIHWEQRKGSQAEAIAYCTKPETRAEEPFESGCKSAQGSRTDIKSAMQMVSDGCSELEIADTAPMVWAKYYKALERYRRLKQPVRDWEMHVELYWGVSGSGKSRKAHEENPGAYWKPYGEWWDGYDGQDVVIIDDFYGWLKYSFVLNLLDRYPLLVPNKGGFTPFKARKIILTSNKRYDEWYPSITDKTPLGRRINKITHFN